jgi:signal transduction histidine kinase
MKHLFASRPSTSDPGRPRVSGSHLRGRSLFFVRVVWVGIAALTLAVFAAAIPAEFSQFHTACAPAGCANRQLSQEDFRTLQGIGLSPGFYAAYTVAIDFIFATVYVAVAALVFWRRPDDRMAQLVSLALLTFGLATFPDTMSVLAAQSSIWRVPVAFLQSLGAITFGLFLYLFPDGRFLPSWTRWVALAWLVWQLPKHWFPEWIDSNSAVWTIWLALAVWSIALGTIVYSQLYRYRFVSNSVQRQQIKWVVFGISAALAGFLGTNLTLVAFFPEPASAGALLAHLAGHLVIVGGLLLIPLSIGVAILRYRLFDIDLVINRALVYGALTASVVGLYVVLVGGIGVVLQVQGNLLVSILAAGLVAVLFQPLRERLQRGVNHLMYGERDDPYAVLSRLGTRIESTLSPEAVLPAAVRTVSEALKLPYAAVESKRDGRFETVASTGKPVDDPLRLPLVYGGETVGRMVLGMRAGEEDFSSTDRRLLEDLTHHIGAAVHAASLTEEAVRLSIDLQRSRERLVSAREEERRRLRRDLHDGLGPQLASQTMTAEAARDLIPSDPERAAALLGDLIEQAQAAVADVRRLVYALRPPALDALGLLGALRSHATHADHGGLRISIEEQERLPPLPAAVEVAAYRIILEAINNVVLHAEARTCEVRLSLDEEPGMLTLEVSDDGHGIAEDSKPGVGLSSMRERAEELGGSCVVEPISSGGTRVRARLPRARDTGEIGLREA